MLADAPGGFDERYAGEFDRQPAGKQFVEHDAKGIGVAAHVDRVGVALGLFRAHIGERAEQAAGLGSERGVGFAFDEAGEAEIEHLGLAGLIDEDVRGLEVAVNDAALVGVRERVADLEEQPQPGVD